MGLFDWLRGRRGNGKVSITPADDQTSLGNLLVLSGLLAVEDLTPLIEEFHATRNVDQLLGQFLVERGVLAEDQLELALLRQKHMRTGPTHDTLTQAMKITARRRTMLHDQAREVSQLAITAINGQEPIKNGSTH